mmetsp:Transcript_107655/g.347465  ORF Transcript_107655/g.347465 Transcript_107655/m.347465 type:complete len:87 (+) Transcript_107655:141-401(+)
MQFQSCGFCHCDPQSAIAAANRVLLRGDRAAGLGSPGIHTSMSFSESLVCLQNLYSCVANVARRRLRQQNTNPKPAATPTGTRNLQ